MSRNTAIKAAVINPLKRVSIELFDHGKSHLANGESSDRDFDRLVAGVHVDNALELYLKFYCIKYDVQGVSERTGLPELISKLRDVLPELAIFGGDLRTFHSIRNSAYHIGLSIDETTLNWAIGRI